MVAFQQMKWASEFPSVWTHDTPIMVCQEDRRDRPRASRAKILRDPFDVVVRNAIIKMLVIDLD